MARFQIVSGAGADHGAWGGATAAHALAAMHRDAGYRVRVALGRIVWPDGETRRLCGDVEDWQITSLCSGPACTRETISGGFCPSHYRQQYRGRPLTAIAEPVERVPLKVRLTRRALKRLGASPARRAREILERPS